MPYVTLTMLEGRSADQRKGIRDGVHAALMEAFGIPEHDRSQVIHEVAGENWDLANPSRVIIEIKVFTGRSVEAKRALYKAVVRNLEEAGVDPLDTFIILSDLPMENWGIRGGHAACDIDLGFKIDV